MGDADENLFRRLFAAVDRIDDAVCKMTRDFLPAGVGRLPSDQSMLGACVIDRTPSLIKPPWFQSFQSSNRSKGSDSDHDLEPLEHLEPLERSDSYGNNSIFARGRLVCPIAIPGARNNFQARLARRSKSISALNVLHSSALRCSTSPSVAACMVFLASSSKTNEAKRLPQDSCRRRRCRGRAGARRGCRRSFQQGVAALRVGDQVGFCVKRHTFTEHRALQRHRLKLAFGDGEKGRVGRVQVRNGERIRRARRAALCESAILPAAVSLPVSGLPLRSVATMSCAVK